MTQGSRFTASNVLFQVVVGITMTVFLATAAFGVLATVFMATAILGS